MSYWPSSKARRVLAALFQIGWSIKRQSGSHRTLSRSGWLDYTFSFHDEELTALGRTKPIRLKIYKNDKSRP